MNSYVAPPDITFYLSLLFLSAVILGGVDSILGVSVAAVLLVILPEKLRALQQYWMILFGIILVLMLISRREGLIPVGVRTYGLKKPRAADGPSEQSIANDKLSRSRSQGST
jgi:branched-chain amino acid transport system permease protein